VGVGTFAGALAFFFRGCIPQSTGTWVLFLILFTTFLVFVVLGGFETTQAAVAVVLKMNRSRKAKAIRARKVFLGLAIAFTLVLLVSLLLISITDQRGFEAVTYGTGASATFLLGFVYCGMLSRLRSLISAKRRTPSVSGFKISRKRFQQKRKSPHVSTPPNRGVSFSSSRRRMMKNRPMTPPARSSLSLSAQRKPRWQRPGYPDPEQWLGVDKSVSRQYPSVPVPVSLSSGNIPNAAPHIANLVSSSTVEKSNSLIQKTASNSDVRKSHSLFHKNPSDSDFGKSHSEFRKATSASRLRKSKSAYDNLFKRAVVVASVASQDTLNGIGSGARLSQSSVDERSTVAVNRISTSSANSSRQFFRRRTVDSTFSRKLTGLLHQSMMVEGKSGLYRRSSDNRQAFKSPRARRSTLDPSMRVAFSVPDNRYRSRSNVSPESIHRSPENRHRSPENRHRSRSGISRSSKNQVAVEKHRCEQSKGERSGSQIEVEIKDTSPKYCSPKNDSQGGSRKVVRQNDAEKPRPRTSAISVAKQQDDTRRRLGFNLVGILFTTFLASSVFVAAAGISVYRGGKFSEQYDNADATIEVARSLPIIAVFLFLRSSWATS